MSNDREWAEPAEQQVAEALNGAPASPHITKIATEIKRELSTKFPAEKLVKSEWIGGDDYSNVGDVGIHLESTYVPLELKFSLEQGRGTAKNLSAKLFKTKIDSSILTYPEFDTQMGLKAKRYELIESLTGKKFKTARAYQNELRIFRDTKPEVLATISDITAPGQEQYAKYVAEKCNQHLDKVNTLVKSILNKHTPGMMYCVIREFGTPSQTVEFMDFEKDNTVTNVQASGKSIRFFNSKGKDVIRFSVHWKNICQGGQSPCFNVFVGNEY